MSSPLSARLAAPLLLALRDCLCAQLARSAAGPVCRCSLMHHAVTPTMEGCDCQCEPDGHGDAWVRLVRLDADTNSEDTQLRFNCSGWLLTIELGVYRCIPVSEDGLPLPAEQLTDIALEAQADMEALLRVLDCCTALDDHDVAVEYWLPAGPEGGCAGGVLQISVAVPHRPGSC